MRDGKSTTTDGRLPAPGFEDGGAPQPINPETGQHGAYYVLTEEERAKGFIRPVRRAYRHVGIQPKFHLRDLTDEEKDRYAGQGYVAFEVYPESESPKTGRFWTQLQLDGGCGVETIMAVPIAETYARDPSYYGATFCTTCRKHLPVEEFVWLDDKTRVGT